jgi:hypothetical protein
MVCTHGSATRGPAVRTLRAPRGPSGARALAAACPCSGR